MVERSPGTTAERVSWTGEPQLVLEASVPAGGGKARRDVGHNAMRSRGAPTASRHHPGADARGVGGGAIAAPKSDSA